MKSRRLALAITLAAATAVAVPQVADANIIAHDYPVPSTGCSATTSPVPPGQTYNLALSTNGGYRDYIIHMPSTYVPGHKKPLVLTYHGRKGDGYDIETYSQFDTLDAIAVYPVGLPGEDGERAWQSAPYAAAGVDDVLFTMDLLDDLQAHMCVDPARIYAVGKSNGGGFVALLACRLPARIAAFGIVAGAFYPDTGGGCGPTAPAVPLIDFHGTQDSIIHYDGDTNNHGQALPAIMDWAQTWANRSGCATTPTETSIYSQVVSVTWNSCQPHKEVQHYRILDGGHTWPKTPATNSGPGHVNTQISATTTIWSFLTAHTTTI
ncbi:alpha/beta hydrolase family esterase [Actinokineospora inagensis]|uniref:alpha/beta hydrolase family esterase n=1 Tax=Actinokineospora inagensis TaxID=103730 RepID=UPI00042106B7|nr:PHB depolymerase family esterase [Actinokineospora inagensis]